MPISRRPFGLLAIVVVAMCLPASVAGAEPCPPAVGTSAPRVRASVYVDTSALAEDQRSAAVEDGARVLERRLRLYGDPNPTVHVEGDRIVVEILSTWDRNDVEALVGRRAFLDFREEGIRPGEWVVAAGRDASGAEQRFTGWYIALAELSFEPGTGRPEILFALDRDGTAMLADITARLVRRQLAIVVDDQPLMIATIQQQISEGRGRISGSFTPREACILVTQLNAGPLPAPVSVEDVDSSDAMPSGPAPLATPTMLRRKEGPEIPALTDQQRVQVADIALRDARVQQLVREGPHQVSSVAVWHASMGLQLLGGVLELTFDDPLTLDGEFVATNYDCSELTWPPYSPVAYQATIEGVGRLYVFVDLALEQVVGISPFGGQILQGPFFLAGTTPSPSTCGVH